MSALLCAVCALSYAGDRSRISSGMKKETVPLKFFQLNIWEGLANVDNGLDVFCDQLVALMPDVASFCEFPTTGDERVRERSAEYILGQAIERIYQKTGIRYYKTSMSGRGTRGVLSRFPVVEGPTQVASTKDPGHQEWFYRTVIDFHGQEVAIYSSHSIHYYYACYLPRGYGDGHEPYGWDKLADGPVSDRNTVIERDVAGDRLQMAVDLKNDTDVQASLGRLCIYAGDLNQPSHLDWTKRTRNLWGHNGLSIPWSVSTFLLANGFSDAYRVVYPNPVKNPGFTWPVYNKDAKKSTAWAPEADERDRIDFVYFRNDDRIRVLDAQMVGPDSTMDHGKPVADKVSKDELIPPAGGVWCSDHRGLLVTFGIRTAVRPD